MTAYHLANTPSLIAMLILIGCLLYLQRRHPQMAVGSWVVGMAFLLLGQLCWFFYDGGSHDMATATHTLRLVTDLLAAASFLVYHPGPFRWKLMLERHGLTVAAFVLLEVLYGTGSQHPVAYLFCAFAGIAGLLQREHPSGPKRVTAVWILLWVLIALAAVFGGFRTAAYWGLASMYTAAAINLQNRLTAGIGRFVIVFSLGIFTATFAFHSLVLLHPFLRPIHDEIWSLQKYFLSVGLLMTLLEQELKTNQWLVAHDTLTGLPNRRQMDACLLHAIATGNAGVLLLDLEDFKKINDSMGREAGNEILQRIAGVLGQITETDETLTRFSGGSFAIVSSRSLAHLPRVLQALIAEPMAVHAHQVQLGTSIGTAFFPADANGYEGAQAAAELVRVADRRMNRNKGGGKGDFLGRWPGLSQIH